jgi:hypothetical protein
MNANNTPPDDGQTRERAELRARAAEIKKMNETEKQVDVLVETWGKSTPKDALDGVLDTLPSEQRARVMVDTIGDYWSLYVDGAGVGDFTSIHRGWWERSLEASAVAYGRSGADRIDAMLAALAAALAKPVTIARVKR